MTPAVKSLSPCNDAGGMLALVTEAFGGRGGIAQYNRDFLSAVANVSVALPISVMTRLAARDHLGALPSGIRQLHAPRGKVAYSLTILREALRAKPEVVYCGHLYMAPLALLAARLANAKLVVQLHGIEIWRQPTTLQRRALEAADLILCVSRDTRRRVCAAVDIAPHKVRVLPNTVAPEFVPGNRAAARAEFGWATEQFILLSVGRLDSSERYKGHDRVLESLPKLRAAKPSIHYIIAGEGSDKERLSALAAANSSADIVTFLGHVSAERLPSLYRAVDLFVLPSTGEGFGIAYIEAMACGTPAIGLCIAGARDALVDGKLGGAPTSQDLVGKLLASLKCPTGRIPSLPAAVQKHFGRPVFAAQAAELMRIVLRKDLNPSQPHSAETHS